jgi:hypothetical protein
MRSRFSLPLFDLGFVHLRRLYGANHVLLLARVSLGIELVLRLLLALPRVVVIMGSAVEIYQFFKLLTDLLHEREPVVVPTLACLHFEHLLFDGLQLALVLHSGVGLVLPLQGRVFKIEL